MNKEIGVIEVEIFWDIWVVYYIFYGFYRLEIEYRFENIFKRNWVLFKCIRVEYIDVFILF